MDAITAKVDVSEGDCNFGPSRAAYVAEHDRATSSLIKRDAAAFMHQALSSPCFNALASARGATLTDTNGRELLDFHGNAVHQLGFSHPDVIDAVKRQLDALSFCPRRYTNEPAVRLAERLGRLAPVTGEDPGKVLFAPSGALAVSTALKLARLATGRYKTISMVGSFHGASMDTISIGGDAIFSEGLGPLMPGSIRIPPYSDEAPARSLGLIESILQRDREVGAIIAEPMRWTTLVAPSPMYWNRLRELCDRYGVLLIVDEVPSCLGRTGRLFCVEHTGIRPDVMVIGKGLGGGVFPMAATIADARLDVGATSALGHYTHEKSPVGAAAALATLDVIERDALVDRAEASGAYLGERLDELVARYDCVSASRGLGLHRAIVLDLERIGEAEATAFADCLLYNCLRAGLSLKIAAGCIVAMSPPLNVTRDEIDRAVSILDGAIEATRHDRQAADHRSLDTDTH